MYMYICIYIYIHIYIYTYIYIYIYDPSSWVGRISTLNKKPGKRDSRHHHFLEAISETATALELRKRPLDTTPLHGGGV